MDFSRGVVAVALLVAAAGCGSGATGAGEAFSPVVPELQEVAELLRAASADRPPKNVAALSQFHLVGERGYEAVKSGKVVVLWGARMPGEGEVAEGKAPKSVIAYEKNTPNVGGYVLLQDGTVEQMTPEQFKAAPKADT
jgi:hypothetical protein